MTNTHITIGGHKVSAGKVCSTSEVKTGDVWIDGKPIYRRVFSHDFGTATATPITVATSSDVSLIDTLISITGLRRWANNNAIGIPIPYYGNASDYAYITNATGIKIEGSSSLFSYVVTIEYTKTTD